MAASITLMDSFKAVAAVASLTLTCVLLTCRQAGFNPPTPFQLSLGAWILMSASLQNIIWIISCVRYCKLLFPKYESVRSTGCPLRPLANCFALSECWKDNGHQKPIKFTLKKSFLNHLIKNMQCSFQKTCIVLWHRNSGGLLGHGIVHIDGWQVNLKHNKCKRREESAKNACKSMVFLK